MSSSEETIWFYCHTCAEEYQLPESSEQCPFCGRVTLESTQ